VMCFTLESRERSVYVVTGGKVRKRPVTTGIRGNNYVEITGGLGESDRVIFQGLGDIREGVKAEIVEPVGTLPKE